MRDSENQEDAYRDIASKIRTCARYNVSKPNPKKLMGLKEMMMRSSFLSSLLFGVITNSRAL